MSYKFDVFISYKHAPLDHAVAGKLQKKLERYHISKEIQKKSGKKKINRVFRDEEELSVGNNLSEEIESQLKETEFLVVVCSPAAKQSIWVQHEIDIFLKYHPASNVLPLLIEGEPQEAFPENLMSLGEPFAADIREDDFKKVLKKLNSEIDRIVARVLYCSLEELRQRQKHYHMKCLLAALSAAFIVLAAFSTYVLMQNNKITAAYNEQLKTESEYLTSDAKRLSESGDYFGAMKDLIKALPSATLNRPLVAKAQYALTNLLNLYETDSAASYYLKAMGQITLTDENAYDFYVDPEDQYLLTHDDNHIYVYDAKHMSLLHSLKTENRIMDEIPEGNYKDGLVYFNDYYSVYCYDYVNNEIIWKKSNPNKIDITLMSNDGVNLWVLTNKTLLLLNKKNGDYNQIQQLSLKSDEYLNDDFLAYCQTSQGDRFGFSTYNDYHGKNQVNYYIYDNNLELIKALSFENEYLAKSAMLLDQDTLILDLFSSEHKTLTLKAMDINNSKLLWKKEFQTSSYYSMMKNYPNDSTHENILAYCYDTQLLILNGLTGDIYCSQDLSSKGITYLTETGLTGIITQDGKVVTYHSDDNTFTSKEIFSKKLLDARKIDEEDTYYVLRNDDTIVRYLIGKGDPNIEKIECKDSISLYDLKIAPYKDRFIMFNEDQFYYLDDKNKLKDFSHQLNMYNLGLSHTIIEEDEGQVNLVYQADNTSKTILNYACIDPQKQKVIGKTTLCVSDYISQTSYDYKNKIFAAILQDETDSNTENSKYEIYIFNTNTQEKESFDINLEDCIDSSSSNFSLSLSPDDDYIGLVSEDSLYFYLINRQSQSMIRQLDLADCTRDYIEEIGENIDDWIHWSDSGEYFSISNQENIFIYNNKGKLAYTFAYAENNEANVLPASCFSPDASAFYYLWDGVLYKRSLSTGKVLDEITIGEDSFYKATWQISEDRIYLLCDSTLYMIDTDEDCFGLLAKIENVESSNISSGKILVSGFYDLIDNQLGLFKEYSLEEILDMAEKELGEDEANE